MPSGVYFRKPAIEQIACTTCSKIFTAYAHAKRKYCSVECTPGQKSWMLDPEKVKARTEKIRQASLKQWENQSDFGPRVSHIGEVYNKLVITKLAGKNKSGEYLWEFLCHCGETGRTDIGSLRNGFTKSCGCSRIYTYQSKRIIHLTTKKGGNIRCHSSWEKYYALYLDDTPLVEKFGKDKVKIPYFYKGKTRTYYVDYLVTYCSGEQHLIEIKPTCFLETNENLSKFKAARIWCVERNIKFLLVTDNEIGQIRRKYDINNTANTSTSDKPGTRSCNKSCS